MFNRIISSRNHASHTHTQKPHVTPMCTLDNGGPTWPGGIIARTSVGCIHSRRIECVCLCNPPRTRCDHAVFSKLIENKLYTRAVRSQLRRALRWLAGWLIFSTKTNTAPARAAEAADFDPRCAIAQAAIGRRRRRHQIDQSIIWVNGRTHSNWIRLAATAIDVSARSRTRN